MFNSIFVGRVSPLGSEFETTHRIPDPRNGVSGSLVMVFVVEMASGSEEAHLGSLIVLAS